MKELIRSISLFIIILILYCCVYKGFVERKQHFLPELKPTHEQLNSLKTKKTIELLIHQTYYNRGGEEMVLQLPLEKELKILFSHATSSAVLCFTNSQVRSNQNGLRCSTYAVLTKTKGLIPRVRSTGKPR